MLHAGWGMCVEHMDYIKQVHVDQSFIQPLPLNRQCELYRDTCVCQVRCMMWHVHGAFPLHRVLCR